MSHFTQVETQVRDLQALKKYLEKCGFKVDVSTAAVYKIINYYGKEHGEPEPIMCHLRARQIKPGLLSGKSELGFHRTKEGKYEMVVDHMDLHKPWAKGFKKGYAYEEVMGMIKAKGYHIASESTDAKKQIHLHVTRSF